MPADLTVGQFVYVIRKRIRVSPEQAIFMFVRNVLPPTGARLTCFFCVCGGVLFMLQQVIFVLMRNPAAATGARLTCF